MCLAELKFPCAGASRKKREDLEYYVGDFFSMLARNGQVDGEKYNHAWRGEAYHTWFALPRPDLLDPKHHSDWVREAFARVESQLTGPFEWQILDDPVRQRFPRLESASFLYLFTHPFEGTSPVRRGDDGKSIPLYLLPVDQEVRQDISSGLGTITDVTGFGWKRPLSRWKAIGKWRILKVRTSKQAANFVKS